MKRILTSASVVAIGVVGAQAQGYSMDTSKPWSVSAALRGFYDDNYTTLPSVAARDSFGFEIAPRVSYSPFLEQTTLYLGYAYSAKYFEDRDENNFDQMHEVDLQVAHQFSPRVKLSLTESFAVAQEPEVLTPGQPTTFLRIQGSNIRNLASLRGTVEMSDQFSIQSGYSNSFYDYENEGDGSYSAQLDRMTHLADINFRWRVVPETIALIGYQYGFTGFTREDLLVPGTPAAGTSEVRDTEAHYVFVGADHTFNPKLVGNARVGVQFTEYVNALPNTDNDNTDPYADLSMTYTYNPGSTMQAGLKYMRQPIDLVNWDGTGLTYDQEAFTLYTAINHRITPRLLGTLNGLFQSGMFQGGSYDGDTEQVYSVGLNLAYEINRFLAAETGYAFDRLDSDVANRSYSRNRVFVGIRGTY